MKTERNSTISQCWAGIFPELPGASPRSPMDHPRLESGALAASPGPLSRLQWLVARPRHLLLTGLILGLCSLQPAFAAGAAGKTQAKGAVSQQISRVNINTADAAGLANGLVGVGLSKAKSIIAYREQHGPFKKVEDLALVKGIGDAIVARNLPRISLSN